MSKSVQILRGTAPLPSDLEERFVRAHGREMNEEERIFFGVSFRNPKRKREQLCLEHRRGKRAA